MDEDANALIGSHEGADREYNNNNNNLEDP